MNETKIVVVEDIDEIRESLIDKINETEGMSCISNYNIAEDALVGIAKLKPHIVIMDIGLPHMSGIECMFRLKYKHPEIKFLMFTIFDHDEKVFEALKAGASGYILKETGSAGVVQAIKELLAGGGPMSSVIAQKVLSSFHRFGAQNNKVEKLTVRQIEILQLLSEGLLYKEIAERLNPPIGVGSVKQHIFRIYKKLEVNNRTEAVNKWLGKH